jgi:hypothetical protein
MTLVKCSAYFPSERDRPYQNIGEATKVAWMQQDLSKYVLGTNNHSLSIVLKEISVKTGLFFVYETLIKDSVGSVQIPNDSLYTDELLSRLLAGTEICYFRNQSHIILTSKDGYKVITGSITSAETGRGIANAIIYNPVSGSYWRTERNGNFAAYIDSAELLPSLTFLSPGYQMITLSVTDEKRKDVQLMTPAMMHPKVLSYPRFPSIRRRTLKGSIMVSN